MKKFFLSMLGLIVSIVLLGGVYFYFFQKSTKLIKENSLKEFIIQGDCMEPTFKNGQKVKLNINYYKTNPVKRGDIIAFKLKTIEKPYVKRVIALPGDVLNFKNGKVFINGQELRESYLKNRDYLISEEEIRILLPSLKANDYRVPPKSYFVLSDNRIRKEDSRKFGFLPQEYIIGKIEY